MKITHTRARSTQRSNLIPKLCADCDQVVFSVISIRFFLSVVVSLHTLFSTAFCLLTRQMWMCIVALRYNVKLDCQMIRSFLHQRKGEEKTKQSKTNQIYMKNKRTILVGWTDRWSDWQGVPTNTPGVIMQKSRQWWLLLFVQQQQKMSQEKTHKKLWSIFSVTQSKYKQFGFEKLTRRRRRRKSTMTWFWHAKISSQSDWDHVHLDQHSIGIYGWRFNIVSYTKCEQSI